jgi:phospholipid transport system substrate-binding protein|tara:strand:- start:163 stop:789 length:627 start_codon:yes stop_codon:yes gene_type:complete
MLQLHKKNLFLFLILFFALESFTDENPYVFIDNNAQKMVQVLTLEAALFETDRSLYEQKIKDIFEPMIDFRRVAASVMGKKYYLLASQGERSEFVLIFKDSLLDTYAETLAQWGDSTITTKFPDSKSNIYEKNVEVKQVLNTGSSKYPISYKLRRNEEGWKIVNIIINGVNLGLTFRNQFQALAVTHDENIDLTLQNWVSDAGDAGIS